MSNVGLYIGCGTDFEIMSRLPELNTCIYIDSMPLTRYGDNIVADIPASKTYMAEFHQNADRCGFIKTNIDGTYPHVYRNYETSQEIYHYFNLSFPIYTLKTNYAGNRDELIKLIHQLKRVTHLIVIGYSPHYSVFKYFTNSRVCFVGDHSTIYRDDLDNLLPYEHDKITNILQREQEQEQEHDQKQEQEKGRPEKERRLQNKIETYIYFDKNNVRFTYSSYQQFIDKTVSVTE
jgi:hypothetical protein